MAKGIFNTKRIMGKRLVSTIGVLSFFIYTAAAQERVLSIDELFQLADQNSKSIQLHSLAIDETTQAVEVAKNAKLPSIRAQVDFNYIGDGCMTDRDFSNGIHADMPHFGNSFVLKLTDYLRRRKYQCQHPESETATATSTTDLSKQPAGFALHAVGILSGFVPTEKPTDGLRKEH